MTAVDCESSATMKNRHAKAQQQKNLSIPMFFLMEQVRKSVWWLIANQVRSGKASNTKAFLARLLIFGQFCEPEMGQSPVCPRSEMR
jgi:hypothetical protein